MLRVLCAALLVFGCTLSVSASNAANKTLPTTSTHIAAQKTIVVLGDSISAAYGITQTQGWVALTNDKIKHSPLAPHHAYHLHNASLSGDTSSGGAQRLPALLKQYQPAIVVIELGGNDALRGLAVSQTETYFKRMIASSTEAKAKVLLIPMQIPPNYGARYVQDFNAMYVRLAKLPGVTSSAFIFKDFADNLAYFQPDRIHPTAAAQSMMVEAVWPSLKSLLK